MEQSNDHLEKKSKTNEAAVKYGLSTKKILSGLIVKYDDGKGEGHYRVRKVTKNFVNLGSIFGKHLYYKNVPKALVTEDEAEWYKGWTQSETYQCM